MKKILIFISLFLLSFSFVYSFEKSEEIDSANHLAKLNIIDNYSNDLSKYRLWENITRREITKIIVNIWNISLNNLCNWTFLDVKSNDWWCKYIEASLREWYISKSNYFRPDDYIKKAELLKMIFKSLNIKLLYNSSNWESNYLNSAIDYWIINKSDLLYSWYDTRWRVFTVIKRSFSVSEKAKNLGYLNVQNTVNENSDQITSNNNIIDEYPQLTSSNTFWLWNLLTSIINEDQVWVITQTWSDTEIIQNNPKCLENFIWDWNSCVSSEKVVECKWLPENASWNKSYKILQYWDWMNWSPSDLWLYNLSMTATECRFKCNNWFTWDWEKCIYWDKKTNCVWLPENATWNNVSTITQKWDWKEWLPKTELVYSLQSSDSECRFKCNAWYRWTWTAQNKCIKEEIIYWGWWSSTPPPPPSNSVNWACTWLKSNWIYYNNTVSYSLLNAPSWTSLSATYNSNPAQNTCQFKCNTWYSWLTDSCNPNNCLSTTKTINWHDYNVPTFNHNTSTNVQSIIWITNWNKKYTQVFKCNLWNVLQEWNETLDLICNIGYVEWPNSTCIANICSWSISDSNAYSNATSQSLSQTWHYSSTPWVCTWNCNSWFTWNWTSCSWNTRISNCVWLPWNSSWNIVSSITQTLSWWLWLPTLTWSYNLTASSTECRFKCNTNYTWNWTSCLPSTQVVSCWGTIPANSTASTSSTYTQTWSWSLWIPTLNWWENQSNCDFNCNSWYTWNWTWCIQWVQTVSWSCTWIPTNWTYYNWTSSYSITSAPLWTSLTASYNANPTQNTCQYKCTTWYWWNGSSCVLNVVNNTWSWVEKSIMNEWRWIFNLWVINNKLYVFWWLWNWTNSSVKLTSTEEYDPTTNVWTLKSPMSIGRYNFTSVILNWKFYVMWWTAWSSWLPTSSVEEYNPITNIWTSKASMNRSERDQSAVSYNNKIYVTWWYWGDRKNLEVYDPITNTWISKSNMNFARGIHKSVAYNNKIYVMWWQYLLNWSWKNTNSLEVYDIATDTWTVKSPMNYEKYDFWVLLFNDKIYVIWWYWSNSKLSSVEVYDIATDTWTVKSPMNYSRSWFTPILRWNKIYVVSWWTFEEYDINANTWTKKTLLPKSKFYDSSVILNDKIYNLWWSYNNEYLKELQEYNEVQPTQLVSWTCTWIGTNWVYYNGTNSYTLTNATAWTSLAASYNANPTQNTCQFKCWTWYSWNGSSCAVVVTWTCKWTKDNTVYYNWTNNYSITSAPSWTSLIASYNANPTQNTCQYKCATWYWWNGSSCTSGSWVTKWSMNDARWSFAVTTYNWKIYVMWWYSNGTSSSIQLSSVEEYDPTTNTWTKKTSMSNAKSWAKAVTINNKIYVLWVWQSLDEYNPITNTWTTKQYSINYLNSTSSVLVLNNKIYVIWWNWNIWDEKDLIVYDPTTDTWTQKASMNIWRSSHSSVVYNWKIYVVWWQYLVNGSWKRTNTVEMYDPTTDTWIQKSSMLTERYDLWTVIYNNKIYAIWWYTSWNIWTVEEYDIGTDTWITKESMPYWRSGMTPILYNNKIYIVWWHGWTQSVYEYNPETNKWTQKPWLSNWRYYSSSILLNDKIYNIWWNYDNEYLKVLQEYSEVQPTQLVSWTCTWIGTNWVYYNGTNSYTLTNAPTWTSLTASYNANPTQNTCQFKCWSWFNWNGSSCASVISFSSSVWWNHSCLVNTNWKLYCWWYNWDWQLWNWTTTNSSTPVLVDWNNSYQQVSVWWHHTCWIRTDWKLYCWGNNWYWRIWDWTTERKTVPTLIDSWNTYIYVHAWWVNTCWIRSNWKLYCWWRNQYWQIWDWTFVDKLTPTYINLASSYKWLSVWESNVCVLDSEWDLYCWWRNDSGQLWLNDWSVDNKSLPMLIDWVNKYKVISVWSTHICWIRSNDKVYCWWKNTYWQVWNWTTTDKTTAILIDWSNTYKQLITWYYYTCWIRTDWKLYCWWDNLFWQIWDWTNINKLTPTLIDQSNTYLSIWTWQRSTCWVRSDSKLYCWWRNEYWQVWDWSTLDRNIPTFISFSWTSLVNWSCTWLPTNSIYYNWTTSYSLSNAPAWTSLSAIYNSNPIQNTCQFKCNTWYTWNWSSCNSSQVWITIWNLIWQTTSENIQLLSYTWAKTYCQSISPIWKWRLPNSTDFRNSYNLLWWTWSFNYAINLTWNKKIWSDSQETSWTRLDPSRPWHDLYSTWWLLSWYSFDEWNQYFVCTINKSDYTWTSLVNWSCTWLPINSIFYNWTTGYSLSNAVAGTSLNASYNANPTQNTCQFKCWSWFSWNWSSCIQSTSCNSPDITIGSYTISACNLWTSIAWTWPESYGNYYQWWRNDTWHTIASTNFYWSCDINSNCDWQNPQNNNSWWAETNTNLSRKWPCPTWRHVPSKADWQWILTAWWWYTWAYWDTNIRNQAFNSLKLPKAWRITHAWWKDWQWSLLWYWSSDYTWIYWNTLMDSYYWFIFRDDYRAYAYPIRCFKN